MQVRAKLRIDLKGADDDEQFHYVYSLLEGDALKALSSWAARKVTAGDHTAESLLERLHRIYHDPSLVRRAAAKLPTLKQGTQNFATFYSKFERHLTDAGGDEWEAPAKIAFLENALNDDI